MTLISPSQENDGFHALVNQGERMTTKQKKSLGSEMARGTKLTPTSTLQIHRGLKDMWGFPKEQNGGSCTLLSPQGPKSLQIAYG